ncbi:MAG: hypothetical protein IJ651_10035 [Bacteroidales bacterium]|nr:hypothetical protein [Bacteroidales bacterium]MBR1571057.1 hypothetical protein [Bacteroidales bacterium]
MKWIRNILKGISLTAALFVFQACYGTPGVYDDPSGEEEMAVTEETPALQEESPEAPEQAPEQ